MTETLVRVDHLDSDHLGRAVIANGVIGLLAGFGEVPQVPSAGQWRLEFVDGRRKVLDGRDLVRIYAGSTGAARFPQLERTSLGRALTFDAPCDGEGCGRIVPWVQYDNVSPPFYTVACPDCAHWRRHAA